MSSRKIRVALAQVNLKVGDIAGNAERIIAKSIEARDEHGCDVLIFPELCLCGYPPEDLLLRPGFQQAVKKSLKDISGAIKGITVVIGAPTRTTEGLFNSCLLLNNKKDWLEYHKQQLPNYGVFDEKRYFTMGKEECVLDLYGIPTALSICEDIWGPSVCAQASKAGAKLMININASPFHVEKLELRKKILKERVAESGLSIIYVNLAGGQDELVFDGGSMIIDSRGYIVFEAPQFEEGLYCVDVAMDDSGLSFSPLYSPPPISREERIYKALVLGIKDYVTKNGFNGVVIGLSGGIDSALTLCLAADTLGPDQIEVLLMPSRFTSQMSIDDAKAMAEGLNVKYDIVAIEEPFTAFLNILAPLFRDLPADATEENIQARCRGILLMAVSNKTGKMVLTTGNKSEMAVGYATLYGDMAGGFAPLKDVSKTLVYALARWRNSKGTVIPKRIIDRPPSAELRADQKDVDSLPPYDILDSILERYIELDQSPADIIAAGYDSKTVFDVVNMVDKNEYKRRQAAPGIKISKRAFGRDRRYPITSGYKEG